MARLRSLRPACFRPRRRQARNASWPLTDLKIKIPIM
jgi:hypothetical protein